MRRIHHNHHHHQLYSFIKRRKNNMKPTNLLRAFLGTEASCSGQCVDGYTAANLISDKVWLRQKGFLLEHFVNPPVNVDFTLPCPCDISYIKLRLARASSKVQAAQIQYLRSCSSACAQQDTWDKVTTLVDPSGEVTLQCGNVLPPHLQTEFPSTNERQRINLQVVKSMRSIIKIRIRILAMKGRVAVSFSSCEAIGVPCRYVNRNERIVKLLRQMSIASVPSGSVNNTASASSNSVNTKCFGEDSPSDAKHMRSLEGTSGQSGRSVPSSETPVEFLDPITCTLMSIPLMLPSGNIIDQSTLDKHIANENRWGRPACDPFTGVPLKCQPLVLTELKSRIDHFLSNNSELCEEPAERILDGRNIQRSGVSRLLEPEQPMASVEISRASTSSVLPIGTTTDNTSHHTFQQMESSSDKDKTSMQTNALSATLDFKAAFAHAAAEARKLINRTTPATRRAVPSGTMDSKQVMTFAKRPKLPQTVFSNCINCASEDGSYKLKCGHRSCRPCVIRESSKTSLKCKECGTESQRGDIVKVNLG